MIALQEELDWQCYTLYDLIPSNDKEPLFVEDFQVLTKDFSGLQLGQRAFEIVMARQMDKGELQTTWFERHGSTPITEIPKHWPAAYRMLVERRIKLIETNKEIGLIEKPEYKRRWNTEPWAEQEQRALKNWLLDRLEDKRYWPSVELQSTARLADRASTDAEFMQVAALYRGRPDFDVTALVAELVESESVPFLPILRYKPTGLRKRAVWEQTWKLQREQDELAARRRTVDQQLNEIRTRINSRFDGEYVALKTMEVKLKEDCITVRDRHAPHISLESGCNASSILDALRNERLKDEGGVAFNSLLTASSAVSDFKRQIESRFVQALSDNPEYLAAEKASESIPEDPDIPVPPKYTSADFLKTDHWRLRGKLDVPKERWISYPHCHTESDPSLVVGWAAWNHLQQAAALVGYYDARKREGWDAKRLTPILAGLDQLLPWIHQWHPEIDPEFGETAGQSYQTMLEHDAHELGLTLNDIRQWTPPATATRGRRARK